MTTTLLVALSAFTAHATPDFVAPSKRLVPLPAIHSFQAALHAETPSDDAIEAACVELMASGADGENALYHGIASDDFVGAFKVGVVLTRWLADDSVSRREFAHNLFTRFAMSRNPVAVMGAQRAMGGSVPEAPELRMLISNEFMSGGIRVTR